MKRDVQVLDKQHFDMAIVGAGIHGATLAYESARAGYRVALFDRGDFACSTSANSLKIIHGGIRYLQHGDIKRMRESIVSRRKMMTFAPHLVKPLACLMPTYGHGIKGREMMRLAFAIYDLIAFDRNKGLPEENRLPCGTALSRDEVLSMMPGIKDQGLTGGAIWYDAIASDTERLILEYVLGAARCGATVANYTEVDEVLYSKSGHVTGVSIRDLQTGLSIKIDCNTVINAAGPWVAGLLGSKTESGDMLLATAINIVVKKRLFPMYAVGLEGYKEFQDKDALIKRGKRLFFFVPWQEKYTMIGTTYTAYQGSPDEFALSPAQLQDMLDDINKVYTGARLTLEDVTFYHGGLLPISEAGDSNADDVQLDKSSQIIDHGQTDGRTGLFSIKGVKYTTAPDIADRMIRILKTEKRQDDGPGPHLLPPPQKPDFTQAIKQLGPQYEVIKAHLTNRYAGRWHEVFAYLVQGENGSEDENLWLCREPPLLTAELIYFINQEMAVTLSDVVFRRSNLAAAEHPGPSILSRIAAIMGDELGWSSEERRRQQEKVDDVFAILNSQGES